MPLSSTLETASKEPQPSRYDLIIFDCDGTLVDSEYLNILAVVEVLQECGLKEYTKEVILERFSGHRFKSMINIISKETGYYFPEDAPQKFLGKVRELAPLYMKPIDGALDVVKTASSYCKIYLVSNGEINNIKSSLQFARMRDFFPDELIINGIMAPNPKPAPDLFLLAAQKAGVLPSRTLVLEDSIVGVTGAIAAGMDVWGFCGTNHEPVSQFKKLLNIGANKVFLNMQSIKEEMDKL